MWKANVLTRCIEECLSDKTALAELKALLIEKKWFKDGVTSYSIGWT